MAIEELLNIDLGALSAGCHDFEYTLDDNFFHELEQDVVLGGNVRAIVRIDAKEDTFKLYLNIQGTVNVTCDRCLDPVAQTVNAEDNLIIKLAARDGEDDDCIYIDMTHPIFNLAWLIYEEISVSLPIVCRHQPGECNPLMEELLQAHLCSTIDNQDE